MPTKKAKTVSTQDKFENKTVSLQALKELVPQVVPAVFEIPEGLVPVGDITFDTINDVVATRELAREAWLRLKKEQESIERLRKEAEKLEFQATLDHKAAWDKLEALPNGGYFKVLRSYLKQNSNVVRRTEALGWDERIKTELMLQNKNYARFLELKAEIAETNDWINKNCGTWKDLYDEAEHTCNELAEAMNDESLRYDVLFPRTAKAGATS